MNSVKANEEDEEKIQKAQMGMTMGRPDIGLGTWSMPRRTPCGRLPETKVHGCGYGLYGHEYGRSGRSRFGSGIGCPPTSSDTCSTAGSSGSDSDIGDGLDLLLRPAGEYRKILHELREAETGTCRFLDLPVLRSRRNTGKFCTNCGKPKPAASPDWTCPSCGQQRNTGKFCMNCGTKKPED